MRGRFERKVEIRHFRCHIQQIYVIYIYNNVFYKKGPNPHNHVEVVGRGEMSKRVDISGIKNVAFGSMECTCSASEFFVTSHLV